MYESKLKNINAEMFKNKSAKFTKNAILKIPKILKNLKESNEIKTRKSKKSMKLKKNYIKNKI